MRGLTGWHYSSWSHRMLWCELGTIIWRVSVQLLEMYPDLNEPPIVARARRAWDRRRGLPA